eukprot:SM000039S14536  [mRNA]  locus=s39:783176:784872:+ [translate_table: standard]
MADLDAVYELTDTLVASAKRARKVQGDSPDDLIAALQRICPGFDPGGGGSMDPAAHFAWQEFSLVASAFLDAAPGMQTMVGPLDSLPKRRRVVERRRRAERPGEKTVLREMEDDLHTDRTSETEVIIVKMFKLLRERRAPAHILALCLNRASFSQTVENFFALSFLVRDGRVSLDAHGMILPRDGPKDADRTGGVTNSAYALKLSFADWKAMCTRIQKGQEIMPDRVPKNGPPAEVESGSSRRTPVKKTSRNRVRDASMSLDCEQSDDDEGEGTGLVSKPRLLLS